MDSDSKNASSQSDDDLKQLITCELCHQIFEGPVVLPCLNTLCINHVDFGLNYQCVFCNDVHQMPENGYPTDLKVTKLMKIYEKYIRIEKINYGKINRNAKNSCKILEDLVDQSQTLANDPCFFIDSYFSKLKNSIDLKKEEYLLLIDNSHEKVIKEIEKLEAKCKQEAQMKTLNLNDLIKTSKHKLDKWNADLQVPDFDLDGNWKRITVRAREESEKLKFIISSFQDELLMYKDLKFEPKPVVANNNFGDLVINEKEKIDVNRSEGTFQLVINDFTSFKRNYEWRESVRPCVIKNVPWKLNAKIEQTEEFDLALGIYVYPEIDDNKLRRNPINTEVRLKILQDNKTATSSNKLKLYRRFVHRYTESIGNGCPAFLLLKEIMDPQNGLYDRRNDSITLEASVKILENLI